jgi:hypothetical protein
MSTLASSKGTASLTRLGGAQVVGHLHGFSEVRVLWRERLSSDLPVSKSAFGPVTELRRSFSP